VCLGSGVWGVEFGYLYSNGRRCPSLLFHNLFVLLIAHFEQYTFPLFVDAYTRRFD
jgi:hypothetical protein